MPEARLQRTRTAYEPDAQARREDEERQERDRKLVAHGQALGAALDEQ